MLGDVSDFVSRLRRVLPARWLGDVAPLADALLGGFGVAWAAIYQLIAKVRGQARLATSTGIFVDSFAAEFLGGSLPRRPGEADRAYIQRIQLELLRPRATRQAMVSALSQLTGQTASVFEPARPGDTGGYNTFALGYNTAGALGNLGLQYQSFVTVQRPVGEGIALFAGYRTGGLRFYGDLSMVETPVTDANIYAAAAAIVPAGYVAWVRIRG